MKVLPLTYLGNVEYFARLIGGECVIDLGENYVKQSYRNRCEILSAGGIDILTVNVAGGSSRTKKPVRDMRIDYSKRWQHRHRMALVSAYANSPYFDHYWERFAPFYEKRYEFLADLNAELLLAAAKIVAPGLRIDFSESYIEPSEAIDDLRGDFEPVNRGAEKDAIPTGITAAGNGGRIVKNGKGENVEGETGKDETGKDELNKGEGERLFFEPYWQVFSEKHPFVPNLSAIDLIFCEGPDAGAIIRRTINKISEG